jgi:hypothetical protein
MQGTYQIKYQRGSVFQNEFCPKSEACLWSLSVVRLLRLDLGGFV